MGFRINKILGFGLDNVNCVSGEIHDCRFNENFSRKLDNAEDFFLYWYQEEPEKRNKIYAKIAVDNWQNGNIEYQNGQQVVFHESECRLDNIILFVSPSFHSEWFRHDSALDYYESAINYPDTPMKTIIEHIDMPIFPWINYWDTSTSPPTRLNEMQSDLMRNITDKIEQINQLKKEGIIWDFVQPIVPPEIVAMVKYLKVFKHDVMSYRLKPMICTYWN